MNRVVTAMGRRRYLPGRRILSGFFILMLAAALGGASTILLSAPTVRAETIPPDSWVYAALRTFELRGLVSLAPTIPYSREETESYVEAILANLDAEPVELGVRERYALERLREEFIGAGERPEDRENRPVFVIREGDRYAAFDVAIGGSILKKVDEKKGEADGLAVPRFLVGFGRRVTLDARYRLRMAPERGLNEMRRKPSARLRSYRGLTAEYERALLSANGSHWFAQIGRDYIQWGSGREEGLLVSQTAGSIDHFGGRLSIGRITVSTFQALLDPGLPRRLAAHRLTVSLPRGIFLGVGETVVYTRRGLDYVYLLPLSVYYANQWNERKDDNVLWALDWKVPLRHGIILYGEFLVDDLQYERDEDAGPDRVGGTLSADALFLLGGRELEVSAGYTRIGMYVYAHKDSLVTRYVAGDGDRLMNPLIGSPLGPDADRWSARVSYAFHPRAVLALECRLIRRGDGNDLREWYRGSDPDPPFPSGAVLKERMISASQLVDLGRGSSLSAGGGVRFLKGGAGDLDTHEGFGWLDLILDL